MQGNAMSLRGGVVMMMVQHLLVFEAKIRPRRMSENREAAAAAAVAEAALASVAAEAVDTQQQQRKGEWG